MIAVSVEPFREAVERASILIPADVVNGDEDSVRNTAFAMLLVAISAFVFSATTLNARLLGNKHVSNRYL